MKSYFIEVIGLPKKGDELRVVYTQLINGKRHGMTEASIKINDDLFWRTKGLEEDTHGRETSMVKASVDDPGILYVKMTEDESKVELARRLTQVVTDAWGRTDMFSAEAKKEMIVITCKDEQVRYYPMLNGTEAEGNKILEIA